MTDTDRLLRTVADKLAPPAGRTTLEEGQRKGRVRRTQNRQRLINEWREARRQEVPDTDPLAVAVLVAAAEITYSLDVLAEAVFHSGD